MTQPPYNADKTGASDDTAAVQGAINDAISYGNANSHAAVTVSLPAGTYLISKGPLNILHSTNLTFTGAGTGQTMLWYARANASGFHIWYNTNVTIENLSEDAQKISSGYDLGETQGAITAINKTARQITVQVESGYPPLNRSDLQNAPTENGWSAVLYTLADPTRYDFDSNIKMTGIAPSADGTTAVITLSGVNSSMYVGEKWMVWIGPGPIFLDAGYGDYGNTLFQNINFYGGALNYAMGDTGSSTGTVTFNNLYCGPPSYQPDRLLTCDEGWQGGNAGCLHRQKTAHSSKRGMTCLTSATERRPPCRSRRRIR